MALLEEIQSKVAANQFEFSQHALDQSLRRHIMVADVREVIASAEIIEDYPSDKYGPSCLLLGWTPGKRPIHLQCSYPSRPLLKLITMYEPDPGRGST